VRHLLEGIGNATRTAHYDRAGALIDGGVIPGGVELLDGDDQVGYGA